MPAPPPTLTLLEELEGLTIALPPRIDLKRLGWWVGLMWLGINTLCLSLMLVPELQRSGHWDPSTLTFMLLISAGLASSMGSLSKKVLSRSQRRVFRDSESHSGVEVWAHGLLHACLMLGLAAEIFSVNQTDELVLLIAMMLVGLLGSVQLGCSRARHIGEVRIHGPQVAIGRQHQWPLEDVESLRIPGDGRLMINDAVVIEGLLPEEQRWIAAELQRRRAARIAALQAAGHDLSTPAAIPDTLRSLQDHTR